jgi:hypothetical protein
MNTNIETETEIQDLMDIINKHSNKTSDISTKFYIETKIDGNRVFPGRYTYYQTLEEAQASADEMFWAKPNSYNIRKTVR